MKNSIKVIRGIVFPIIFLMAAEAVIVECVDIMTIRSILIKIMYIVCLLLAVILTKTPRFTVKRVTIIDILSIVMFIGLIMYMGKMLLASTDIETAFQGDNYFALYYGESDGESGYNDIESFFKDEIENSKRKMIDTKREEIYRTQVEENIFVYLKEGGDTIVEYTFFRQNDLFYCSGSKALLYDVMISSGSYTTEETIRKDVANTMWRGVGLKNVGAPAWGVSTDEQIFSLTINNEKVNDVIPIYEKNGKKYYFWITTNVGEIKTIDDVKAAKIEMNSSQ